MLEEMRRIDTSSIEHLVRIKEEQIVLMGRLEKMDARKDSVSGPVYQRVKRDYESRLVELEREARPLKDQARSEYAKLQTLHRTIEARLQAAQLDREELVFRHELEEITDDDFTRRLADCEGLLAERQQELEESAALRGRFLEAFQSEAELEAEATIETGTPQEEPPPPDATPFVPLAPDPPPDATAMISIPAEVSGDETYVNAPPADDATQLTGAPLPPPEATQMVSIPSEQAPPPGATMILSAPRLVLLAGDTPSDEHPLRPDTTLIGRSVHAHVRVQQTSVSRQHAQITLSDDGYHLIDLGSENGTLVNGSRVGEHLLVDGDVIQVGNQKLVFRT